MARMSKCCIVVTALDLASGKGTAINVLEAEVAQGNSKAMLYE